MSNDHRPVPAHGATPCPRPGAATAPSAGAGGGVAPPRLRAHSLRLGDGSRVGLIAGGGGIPLVVAHGFSLAGALYVPSLSLLASLGFRVLAVDTAGHGSSETMLPRGWELASHRRFLARVLDELGVRKAVLCGHSLGGRLVSELAAADPQRAAAVLLVDAAVGGPWDDLASFARCNPGLLAVLGGVLAADTLGTLFLSGDQGRKLQGLGIPQGLANVMAPWRLVPPALSVLLAPGSRDTLAALARHRTPVFILHGGRDPVVPLAAARDAAGRSGASLVVVHGGAHSWLLECPETLRAIVSDLLGDGLGRACVAALAEAGLDPATVGPGDLARTFYAPDAWALALDPAPAGAAPPPRRAGTHRPCFAWSRFEGARAA